MKSSSQTKSNWFGQRQIVRLMLLAALLILGVMNFSRLLVWAGALWNIAVPLIIGCIIAYIMNIISKSIGRIWFPRREAGWAAFTRRPVSVLVSVLLIIGLLALVIVTIIPGLSEAVTMLARELPRYVNLARQWLVDLTKDHFPTISESIAAIHFDWNLITSKLSKFMESGFGGLVSSAFSVIGAVTDSISSFIIGLIFSVFLLLEKKHLKQQYGRLLAAFLNEKKAARIDHALKVGNRCLSGFIVGQSISALLQGILVFLFLTILRTPFTTSVAVLVGTTALLPVIGGYIGAAAGAFLILTVNPSLALWFLFFIIIVQAVVGNVIYPRLVGVSMGLPSVWVLFSVTVGGGLAGIGGMIFGVPIMGTVYQLLAESLRSREAARAASPAAASEKTKNEQ